MEIASYLIKKQQEATEIKNKETSKKSPVVEKEDQALEKKPSMVPILSRRSLVILAVGLVVGVLIAFAYWIISPTFIPSEDDTSGDSTGTGLLGFLGVDPGGPYMSRVSIQLVNPGTEYEPLYVMQQIAEYYAAKHNSLPFFEFLNKELDKQPIDYSYTVDELDAMVTTEYDYNSEIPAIRLSITADTEEEVANLAVLVPRVFLEYLEEEERDRLEQQYLNTSEEMEIVKDELLEAQQELEARQSEEIFNNPNYIALKARVDALQQELDNQINTLALQYLEGSELQEEYDKTLAEMEQVAAKLVIAELELQSASGQDSELSLEDNAYSIILEAKIRGLQSELDSLIAGTTETMGLTEMISSGITSGPAYQSLMLSIETTAEALAEAQMEYEDLMNQNNQQSQTTNLDYHIAQIKVDTLTTELQVLQDRLVPIYTQIINLDEENDQSDDQLAFDRISIALAEATEELEEFEKQLGYDSILAETELNLAQDRVNTLASRLWVLTDELALLTGSDVEATEYLVAGNPSVPAPVLPERSRARNTLLTGAIAGIIVAWVILNFRWLVNLVSPSGGRAKPDEDEEE